MYPIDLLKVCLMTRDEMECDGLSLTRATRPVCKSSTQRQRPFIPASAMRSPPSQELKDTCHYGKAYLVSWSEQVRTNPYPTAERSISSWQTGLTPFPGPAHAVYFATYEIVKQAMGGNASGHHPFAAGQNTSHIKLRV